MKRRRFLQVPIALAAAAATNQVMNARGAAGLRQTPTSRARGVVVKAGADRDNKPIEWFGATFRVMASGKDNQGRSVIFDWLRNDNVGPALHVHTDCDEWFCIRDGEFKVQVGDQILRLSPGDSVLVPQNTPHAFVKTSAGVGRMIVVYQPAATIEEYFRTVIGPGDESPEARRALGERHGIRFVGESLIPD